MTDTTRSLATAARVALAVVAMLVISGCPQPPKTPGELAAERCVLHVGYRVDRLLSAATAPPDGGTTDGGATNDPPAITAAEAERAELIGSWDGFHRPGLRAFRRDDPGPGAPPGDWRLAELTLPPGEHSYGIVIAGRLFLDERNPQSGYLRSPLLQGDPAYATEASRVVIPDCDAPQLTLLPPRPLSPGALRFDVLFSPGRGGAALDRASLQATLRNGPSDALVVADAPLTSDDITQGATARLTITTPTLPPGKYTLTLAARDRAGRAAPPASASAFVESAAPRALGDGLVYQIMVDRFFGAGPLPPPRTPTSRAGGTLTGVQTLLESGYFDKLSVSTLWLSPVYQNPRGVFPGRLGAAEAYHGYWPVSPRDVEPQLGGPGALDQLIAAAHRRGLRVILDAVPNHVFQDHPYYQQHSRRDPSVSSAPDPDEASWFNDGPRQCICGDPGCGWGERLEDCWFEPFLPDLNWRHPAAAMQGTADLAYWMDRYDLDGLRLDAVPMMPRAATRRIVRALRDQTVRATGIDRLLLGETYTGPGDYGRLEIRAYLGKIYDGLDSQFDFPLMWALRQTFASATADLPTLEAELDASRRAFAGSGAVIGHIVGNHDTTRFVSEAAGDLGKPQPPPQPTSPEPYQRHLLALTVVLTQPGLPVLYYGDEVGLAGDGDPDCRRVLPDLSSDAAEAALLPPQRDLLQRVRRLTRLRACASALRSGVRRVVYLDPDHEAALHGAAADAVLVVLSRDRSAAQLRVPGVPAGDYVDVLSGRRVTAVSGQDTAIAMPPLSPAVFVAAGSPCL